MQSNVPNVPRKINPTVFVNSPAVSSDLKKSGLGAKDFDSCVGKIRKKNHLLYKIVPGQTR